MEQALLQSSRAVRRNGKSAMTGSLRQPFARTITEGLLDAQLKAAPCRLGGPTASCGMSGASASTPTCVSEKAPSQADVGDVGGPHLVRRSIVRPWSRPRVHPCGEASNHRGIDRIGLGRPSDRAGEFWYLGLVDCKVLVLATKMQYKTVSRIHRLTEDLWFRLVIELGPTRRLLNVQRHPTKT